MAENSMTIDAYETALIQRLREWSATDMDMVNAADKLENQAAEIERLQADLAEEQRRRGEEKAKLARRKTEVIQLQTACRIWKAQAKGAARAMHATEYNLAFAAAQLQAVLEMAPLPEPGLLRKRMMALVALNGAGQGRTTDVPNASDPTAVPGSTPQGFVRPVCEGGNK